MERKINSPNPRHSRILPNLYRVYVCSKSIIIKSLSLFILPVSSLVRGVTRNQNRTASMKTLRCYNQESTHSLNINTRHYILQTTTGKPNPSFVKGCITKENVMLKRFTWDYNSINTSWFMDFLLLEYANNWCSNTGYSVEITKKKISACMKT